MPLNIKIMGINQDRVTFMIDAEYDGRQLEFKQNTFSMSPGETLTIRLEARLPGKSPWEIEATPEEYQYDPQTEQTLYKIE